MLNNVIGEETTRFLDRYKDRIQNYIMTGHEKGWKHCDILSANTFSHDEEPNVLLDLSKIMTLNVKTTFASSSCLLVSYNIESKDTLSFLIEFGLRTIQYIRLALVITMSYGTSLNMITNTTKLPFLIAAELGAGKEQFLCPIVGKDNPLLEHDMCKPSFLSVREKQLRIGIVGIPPHFILDLKSFNFDGTTIRMMKILEEKLYFTPKIVIQNSFTGASTQVYHVHK